jgi:hypothetical protein
VVQRCDSILSGVITLKENNDPDAAGCDSDGGTRAILTCSKRIWLLAFSLAFPLDHFC